MRALSTSSTASSSVFHKNTSLFAHPKRRRAHPKRRRGKCPGSLIHEGGERYVFNCLWQRIMTRPATEFQNSLSIQTVVGRNFASEKSSNKFLIEAARRQAFVVGCIAPFPPIAMLSGWAQCPLAKFIPVKRPPSKMLARRFRYTSTLRVGGRGNS